ncbi:MAG: phosphonate ABC transporter, permease protein PhnE [Desulfopila sp.]|jgi:phosphonate transport system permease protein|nr:phosphonate ABC transporter, permease protein PhnE [Desulfopila sp.]
MPVSAVSITLPPEPPRRSIGATVIWALVVGLVVWGIVATDLRIGDLLRGTDNMSSMVFGSTGSTGRFLPGFFPPDFTMWRIYLEQMVVTMHMAIWGTLLALLTAIPFGLMSATNLAPWWVYQPARRLMDASRAINDLVFALIFVAAVGLGPMAGMLALWISTSGALAKLFSEAVEAIDPRPVDGIAVTGAGMLEEIIYGVIPQVMPLWVSYTLYRFESNVRSATVVGIVGAGGIGMVFSEAMRSFDYPAAGSILIIIILTVVALDVLSGYLRRLYL